MIAVKGYFDGDRVHLLESIPNRQSDVVVVVVFMEDTPTEEQIRKSRDARRLLRGCAEDENSLSLLLEERKKEK